MAKSIPFTSNTQTSYRDDTLPTSSQHMGIGGGGGEMVDAMLWAFSIFAFTHI